jgi:hypothetical protein
LKDGEKIGYRGTDRRTGLMNSTEHVFRNTLLKKSDRLSTCELSMKIFKKQGIDFQEEVGLFIGTFTNYFLFFQ